MELQQQFLVLGGYFPEIYGARKYKLEFFPLKVIFFSFVRAIVYLLLLTYQTGVFCWYYGNSKPFFNIYALVFSQTCLIFFFNF